MKKHKAYEVGGKFALSNTKDFGRVLLKQQILGLMIIIKMKSMTGVVDRQEINHVDRHSLPKPWTYCGWNGQNKTKSQRRDRSTNQSFVSR